VTPALRLATIAGLLAALAGCASTPTPKTDFTKLVAAKPRSILVVPVVNKSVDLPAAEQLLSALTVPVAERGYYVFPVNLVKRMLEDDGLADASLVHGADTTRLAALFGADAVLYVTIEQWTAEYAIVETRVIVDIGYALRDGKTGDLLWSEREKNTHHSPAGTGKGWAEKLITAIVNAALEKGWPDYMPLARAANESVMAYPGRGIPAGPYREEYGKDYKAP
jgi:hypothetical protein